MLTKCHTSFFRTIRHAHAELSAVLSVEKPRASYFLITTRKKCRLKWARFNLEEDDGSGARNARWQSARVVESTGSGPTQRWTVVWLEKKDGVWSKQQLLMIPTRHVRRTHYWLKEASCFFLACAVKVLPDAHAMAKNLYSGLAIWRWCVPVVFSIYCRRGRE